MGESATPSATEKTEDSVSEWYGFGKIGWTIYALVMVMNLSVLVTEPEIRA